jgi:hypothetical protein
MLVEPREHIAQKILREQTMHFFDRMNYYYMLNILLDTYENLYNQLRNNKLSRLRQYKSFVLDEKYITILSWFSYPYEQTCK